MFILEQSKLRVKLLIRKRVQYVCSTYYVQHQVPGDMLVKKTFILVMRSSNLRFRELETP